MSEMIIHISDLSCCDNLPEEKLKLYRNRKFNLELLPTEELSEEMRKFIIYRGKKIKCSSIKCEIYGYNQMAHFLSESLKDMKTFVGADIAMLERKCKAWLMKNDKPLFISKTRKELRANTHSTNEIILYMKKAWRYFNPAVENSTFVYDSDTWTLENMGFDIRTDPTRGQRKIYFNKIKQDGIKEEIKKIIYAHLQYRALGTIFSEITSLNRFSRYLYDNYPEIESLTCLDREIIENYLIHTYTEATGRKNYRSELSHLKSILISGAKILECEDMATLFHSEDITFTPRTLYKYYSDNELIRLNAAISKLNPQIARLLFLHQLLGTRISETLTLRQDSIFKDEEGRLMIRIYQIKTRKEYEKTINEDVVALIEKASEYTNQKYGKSKFVFVSSDDPDNPMQYTTIQYQLMAMINENDLKDDTGELFGVGTHIYRHNYGKRLTDLHTNDEIIAELLGHQNLWSVKYYRKISNNIMTDETRARRNEMDETLKAIMKGW